KLEDGREIEGIDYEAHGAMAEHQLAMIAEQAAARFELRRVIIRHRVGFVAVGEASLFLQVAAGHRGAAFEASKWIVDELKLKVPIWKHPRLRQGYGAAGPPSQNSGAESNPLARVADAGPRSPTAATVP
ncbi:MAG TPA: molybdenum cofactor biosynthesis protein MoaE, partial [Chthoniobacterales bacterium]|nr:molybdenum cofactor biosynthesis protein MoaE [Chthoniobacterales bacterium]